MYIFKMQENTLYSQVSFIVAFLYIFLCKNTKVTTNVCVAGISVLLPFVSPDRFRLCFFFVCLRSFPPANERFFFACDI